MSEPSPPDPVVVNFPPAPPPDWMANQLQDHIDVARSARSLLPQVRAVGEALCAVFARGGILYSFGNGGSAADAQHFTGEIIGHYKRHRRALGAVTLSTDPSTMTCIGNDYGFDYVFSRQLEGLLRPGDAVAAFSTSGTSANIVAGLGAARERGATTVFFGGGDGGHARGLADFALISPSSSTPRIQELHTFMLHTISEVVDSWAAGEDAKP